MYTHLFIIDDDPIFRLITVKLIEKLHLASLKLYECKDGEVGLIALKRLNGSSDKVIVLLDINMPVINGWGCLDKLKLNKNYNIKNITVFIVSSSTDKSDIIKASSYDIIEQFLGIQVSQLVFI